MATPEHWDYARDDRLWDVRRPGSFNKIQPGDDIFFWLAKSGFVSWVRATSSLFPLGEHARPARWTDLHEGGYTHRFEFEVVSEDVAHPATWTELQVAAGRNYAPPAPANPVDEPAAQQFLRSRFGTQFDIGFPIAPTEYEPGEDMRVRGQRQIALRRGQSKFRTGLIVAYGGACAITRSTVTSVLEAAHIDRYYGEHTNHITNGLLLRSDIHTLFDLGHLTVDSTLSVALAPWLQDSEYRPLHGKTLQLPHDATAHPSIDALARHRESCDWL